MQQGSNQWVAAAATAVTWCTVVLVVPVQLLGSIVSAVLGQDLWQVPTLACWVPLAMLQGTLLVASLSGTTSRQELLYLFSQYGELREVRPVAAQAALTVIAGMPAVVSDSSTAAQRTVAASPMRRCALHMLEFTAHARVHPLQVRDDPARPGCFLLEFYDTRHAGTLPLLAHGQACKLRCATAHVKCFTLRFLPGTTV